MNKLLPYGLKDTPEAIFAAPAQSVIQYHLLDLVTSTIGSGEKIDHRSLLRLSWQTDLICDLLQSQILSDEDCSIVVSAPSQAINIVYKNPAFLPRFRKLIMSSTETVESLFWLQRIAKDPMLDVEDDEILDALKDKEPGRWINVLGAVDPDAHAAAQVEMSSQAEQLKYSSAAWALEWLSRNRVLDEKPLEQRLVDVLSTSEMHSYLAMWLLRSRILDPIVWAPLESAIKTPRWAYHALSSGVVLELEQQVHDILLTHPAWLVEYLVDTKANREKVRRDFLRASELAHSHELIADLHHWFKASTIVHMVRRGGLAPSSSKL